MKPTYTDEEMEARGWTRIHEIGSWIKVEDGEIICCPIWLEGGGSEDEAGPVELVDTQAELDLINERMHTNFVLQDFTLNREFVKP